MEENPIITDNKIEYCINHEIYIFKILHRSSRKITLKIVLSFFYSLIYGLYCYITICLQLPLHASAGELHAKPPASANRVNVGLYTCIPRKLQKYINHNGILNDHLTLQHKFSF